jgi:WD40 repeat protein
MAMQYDVKSGHLNESGFFIIGRQRLKGLMSIPSTTTAGTVEVFDTATAPVTATYARSTTTITVTKSSHGLLTGQVIGIAFTSASGASATDGNYAITVTNANTFTITDINSGTVASSTACRYVLGSGYMMSFDTNPSTVAVPLPIPGEGILAQRGLYAFMSNQLSLAVFYG